MITENVFEARFRFIEEMIRLGADARTDGHHAVVRGVPGCRARRCGRRTSARASAWCWPGCARTACTEVWDVFHIDRGYPQFVENMQRLGADVSRVAAPPERD